MRKICLGDVTGGGFYLGDVTAQKILLDVTRSPFLYYGPPWVVACFFAALCPGGDHQPHGCLGPCRQNTTKTRNSM